MSVFDIGTARALLTQRSWWRVRYSDGRTINEWDGIDWSAIPRKGLVAVRLYCPNGQVAELGNTNEAGERVFQFKGATMTLGRGSRTDFHLIGIVTGLHGECHCAAWEYATCKLATFQDNVFHMQYQNVGVVSADHVGIKPA